MDVKDDTYRVADTAVELAELTRGAESWVEWMEVEERERES